MLMKVLFTLICAGNAILFVSINAQLRNGATLEFHKKVWISFWHLTVDVLTNIFKRQSTDGNLTERKSGLHHKTLIHYTILWISCLFPLCGQEYLAMCNMDLFEADIIKDMFFFFLVYHLSFSLSPYIILPIFSLWQGPISPSILSFLVFRALV